MYQRGGSTKPFLDLECQFFKLEYDNAADMQNLEHLTKPEQVATKAFIHVVERSIEDHKSSLTLEELSQKYCFKIKIENDFPQGAGLGSSAAFNVVLAGSVYIVVGKIINDTLKDPKDIVYETTEELWKIKRLADYGEGFLHKSPSGIDTSIVTLGGMIRFKKSEDPDTPPTSKFPLIFGVSN